MILWSIFPKLPPVHVNLGVPSIWTPLFAESRGCGPITCCPSAGVGTPPLHKPVSSDSNVSVEGKEPIRLGDGLNTHDESFFWGT